MQKNRLIITDVGSTTTKAVLLQKIDNVLSFISFESSPTTVEAPLNDVKIGIFNSLKKMEINQNISLLHSVSTKDKIIFNDDVSYITTSSAGGGLQILVIGLSMAVSVKLAQKVSLGVGGVLLDTIALDDGKSLVEKLLVINNSHPDIILFCGGIDGGGVLGIYRLIEILKIANPSPKFKGEKVPLVYAGNSDALEFIQKSIPKEKYDVYIVENIMPSLKSERLEPAKLMLHDLFMCNVMEQAPGYSLLKKLVISNIIPTPASVLNIIEILSKTNKYLISFDIGGATTDVFSGIDKKCFRSLNANSGMSYSIGNILKDLNYEIDIKPYVNIDYQNDNNFYEYLQNYIGNKILYPNIFIG